MLGEARAEVRAVSAEADEKQADALRREARVRVRERRARLAVVVAVALAVVLSVLAVGVSVASSTTRAEDVTREITPQVTEQVIRDSRAARADAGRTELARWNSVLSSRQLPVVADPGPAATADQVTGAAITARVLATLPPVITDDLRAQVADGRVPAVLPSSNADAGRRADTGGVTVTLLPGPGERSSTGGRPDPSEPASRRDGAAAGPGSTVAPSGPSPLPPVAPQPRPTPRQLLPDLPFVPRLPLLGG